MPEKGEKMNREDLFTLIHKGLRAMLYDMGLKLQTNDFMDEPVTSEILSHMRNTLELMNHHADYEEGFIFPELRAFEPGLVETLELDHREIERLGSILESTMAGIEGVKGADAFIGLGDRLQREFNAYLAFFLKHLNYEEAEAIQASQRHFSDDELRIMRGNIVAATPAEQNTEFMRWMFSSANSNELAESLVGIKASGIPPQALEGMLAFARGIVGEEKWEIIQRKAGM